MRNLFLLLLLINLLAWSYQKWIILPDDPIDARHIEQNYPRLAAVNLSPAVAGGETDREDVANSAENAGKCVKIGPIVEEKDAVSLVNSLRSRDIEVSQQSGTGQVWMGHWVQVVGFDDRAAAEQARDRLVEAGLQDAYVVSGGEELKVSLGVFKSSASSDSTVVRAQKAGFSTRIEERYRPDLVYWLTARLDEGREWQPGELRSDTGRILRTETVECAAADG